MKDPAAVHEYPNFDPNNKNRQIITPTTAIYRYGQSNPFYVC